MSDLDDEQVCPLCVEELDISDKNFLPCPCGYRVCMWCWHHIRENLNGLCPACRTPYNSDPHIFAAIDRSEVAKIQKDKKKDKKSDKPEKVISREKSLSEKSSGGAVASGPIDRKHLHNYRVVQRNLVYVIGMPASSANEDTLRKPEFFGQYGKITKVVVHKNNSISLSTVSVYVTYANREDAKSAIQALDGFWLEGHQLRASFGTTKYCNSFVRGVSCSNPECVYLHDFGEDEDRYTKEEIVNPQTAVTSVNPSAGGKSSVQLMTGTGGPSGTGRKVVGESILPPPVFTVDSAVAANNVTVIAEQQQKQVEPKKPVATAPKPGASWAAAIAGATASSSSSSTATTNTTSSASNSNNTSNNSSSNTNTAATVPTNDSHNHNNNSNTANTTSTANNSASSVSQDINNTNNNSDNSVGGKALEHTGGDSSKLNTDLPPLHPSGKPSIASIIGSSKPIQQSAREPLINSAALLSSTGTSNNNTLNSGGLSNLNTNESPSLSSTTTSVIGTPKQQSTQAAISKPQPNTQQQQLPTPQQQQPLDTSSQNTSAAASPSIQSQVPLVHTKFQYNAFNGFGNCSVFAVPISSFQVSVWNKIMSASSPELSMNPFALLNTVSINELLELTLPPIDAGMYLPAWPKPLLYYYANSMNAIGVPQQGLNMHPNMPGNGSNRPAMPGGVVSNSPMSGIGMSMPSPNINGQQQPQQKLNMQGGMPQQQQQPGLGMGFNMPNNMMNNPFGGLNMGGMGNNPGNMMQSSPLMNPQQQNMLQNMGNMGNPQLPPRMPSIQQPQQQSILNSMMMPQQPLPNLNNGNFQQSNNMLNNNNMPNIQQPMQQQQPPQQQQSSQGPSTGVNSSANYINVLQQVFPDVKMSFGVPPSLSAGAMK